VILCLLSRNEKRLGGVAKALMCGVDEGGAGISPGAWSAVARIRRACGYEPANALDMILAVEELAPRANPLGILSPAKVL